MASFCCLLGFFYVLFFFYFRLLAEGHLLCFGFSGFRFGWHELPRRITYVLGFSRFAFWACRVLLWDFSRFRFETQMSRRTAIFLLTEGHLF